MLTRQTARLNGAWRLAITKLDVLTGIDPLKICVAYEVKGKRYDRIPPGNFLTHKIKPIYEELPGWHEATNHARSLGDLPANARHYLERISQLSGVELAMVGVGAAREATIVLCNPFLN